MAAAAATLSGQFAAEEVGGGPIRPSSSPGDAASVPGRHSDQHGRSVATGYVAAPRRKNVSGKANSPVDQGARIGTAAGARGPRRARQPKKSLPAKSDSSKSATSRPLKPL